MRRRRSDAARRTAFARAAAGLLLAPTIAAAQDANESGAQALLLPMGARIVGVGGAAAAARYGGESALSNPAALGFATARELSLVHGQDFAGRRDLLTVVREVDDKILAVFTEAYTDVAREFETVFATLFPGGEGRLVLTDPSDMLTTGIEVEARPPGKKVKRLSLLSGGERSLVAVAFLVALFKARPSPFYILDEVDAALDDTNLGRLLEIYEELRENSQLLVITHQKRTMEVGDALYGVTMRGDGVSAVISQRLREAEPA